MATREPAVVVSTSGTAVANHLPAVIEADLSAVPLIVISADRPPESLHVGANQTIDQVGIFGGTRPLVLQYRPRRDRARRRSILAEHRLPGGGQGTRPRPPSWAGPPQCRLQGADRPCDRRREVERRGVSAHDRWPGRWSPVAGAHLCSTCRRPPGCPLRPERGRDRRGRRIRPGGAWSPWQRASDGRCWRPPRPASEDTRWSPPITISSYLAFPTGFGRGWWWQWGGSAPVTDSATCLLWIARRPPLIGGAHGTTHAGMAPTWSRPTHRPRLPDSRGG